MTQIFYGIFDGTLTVFVAEVSVQVQVIGSSVSTPMFAEERYTVTIGESTPRFTDVLTVTADKHPTGD